MENIFWLRKDLIAGRTGPNNEAWRLEDLKAAGISAILSVNDGEGCHLSLIEQLGFQYACIPMSSNAPARKGDKEICITNLPKAVDFILKSKVSGTVLIHCRSGKDRTGLVMAAYLMVAEKMAAKQAMDEVLSVRPIAFSAEGWMAFCLKVLTDFESQIKISRNS